MSRSFAHGEGLENIQNLDELQNALDRTIRQFAETKKNFATQPVHGRLYPADTITYQSGTGLVQSASSPSYWGGLWSLTCCKHCMRDRSYYDSYFEETDDGVYEPTEPLLIFTTASIGGSASPPGWDKNAERWLASVALVTRAFESMADYGEYLMDKQEDVWKPRITTQHEYDTPEWALRHGDCHVDLDGKEVVGVGRPSKHHDHVDEENITTCGCELGPDESHDHHYQKDNAEQYLKFVAESPYWLGWQEPSFYYTDRENRPTYGLGKNTLAYSPSADGDRNIVFDVLESIEP